MIDSLPLWVAFLALPWWTWAAVVIVLEVRAALREYNAEKACDPVVVTASDRPSNRYARGCKTVGGVR